MLIEQYVPPVFALLTIVPGLIHIQFSMFYIKLSKHSLKNLTLVKKVRSLVGTIRTSGVSVKHILSKCSYSIEASYTKV